MNIHIKSVFENVIVDDKDKQIETLTRWQDPTIEEYKKEIQRLNNIIAKIKASLKNRIKSVPETMAEVYEDEFILNLINKLEEGK